MKKYLLFAGIILLLGACNSAAPTNQDSAVPSQAAGNSPSDTVPGETPPETGHNGDSPAVTVPQNPAGPTEQNPGEKSGLSDTALESPAATSKEPADPKKMVKRRYATDKSLLSDTAAETPH